MPARSISSTWSRRGSAWTDPDPAAIEEALGYFRKYARVLGDHLKCRRYLVGDGLTVADFAVG